MTELTGEQILELPLMNCEYGYNTIREYLKGLLKELWNHGEGFSGKRPFGNSGWEYDLYYALVASGNYQGAYEVDEDGYGDARDYDITELNNAIFIAIAAL